MFCAEAILAVNVASGTGGVGKLALPVIAVRMLLQICSDSPSGTLLSVNFTFAICLGLCT